ncbi:hypothetical protein, variant [Exophiala oligosperma]|uniref:Uncharacterized protein n=1 Tax=Exophiala oligosperma TaxID=215243 RepID=A0A0D2DKG6_9EURO|nr:uncharacterized protein PV06_04543 [Exophiala oligosperma]XP_016263654.1 hypothetical protein, variant [Exophiala oligosperma]KIW43437.1 hypothetical protein PV06_04543 [Exophiala oligosperma]KIW43438.1 hypothetical protein, variant [Exophiala oligosperma]
MPFFSRRNKPESTPIVGEYSPPRPDTADSSFPRPRPRPAPGTLPDRYATGSPVSFTYDNGYGRIESQLIQEQHLPSNIKTTEQLVEFIRARDQDNNRVSSASSHYSTESTFVSSVTPNDSRSYSIQGNPYEMLRPAPQNSRVAPSSFASPRPGPQASRVVSNPLLTGFSRRYVSAPVLRVLPGTTRKHEYQGYWLAKGTMRRLEILKTKTGKHKERKTKSVGQDHYAETSGWYDD